MTNFLAYLKMCLYIEKCVQRGDGPCGIQVLPLKSVPHQLFLFLFWLSSAACRICSFPTHGFPNPWSLQWKRGILTTRPPEKSPCQLLKLKKKMCGFCDNISVPSIYRRKN